MSTASTGRFRVVFWLVAGLGALPSLVSGIWLLGRFRIDHLCGPRAAELDDLAAQLRWMRLHQMGGLGAALLALLVIGYALERRQNRALVGALGVLLLALFGAAGWSSHVMPWRALSPTTVSMQDCLQQLDEVRRLRFIYWLHAGSGLAAILLTLALTDAGARRRSPTSSAP